MPTGDNQDAAPAPDAIDDAIAAGVEGIESPDDSDPGDVLSDDAPTDDAPADDAPSGDTSGDTPADASDPFARVQEITGVDYRDKYGGNPDKLLQGLAEGQKLIGRRNDDAQQWQQFNSAIRGHESEVFTAIEQVLTGKAPEPPAAPSTSGDSGDLPATFADYSRALSRYVDDKGELKPGVDPNAAEKLLGIQNRMQDVLYQLVMNPEAVLTGPLSKAVGDLKTEISSETTAANQQQAIQREIEALDSEHASALYIDGKPHLFSNESVLTDFGQKVLSELRDLQSGGMPWGPKMLDKAIRAVQATAPKPQGTRKVTPRARRQTDDSPPPGDQAIDPKAFFRRWKEKYGDKPGAVAAYMASRAKQGGA